MTRRLLTFVLLGILTLGSALASTRTLAEDGDGVPGAHPLVGSWLITFPGTPGTPPSLYSFGADGTVVGSSASGARHGSWEATGDHSGALTVLGLDGEGPSIFRDLVEITGSIDVDENGDAFSFVYHGALVAADETALPSEAPSTAEGQRIVVEQLTAPGTQVLGGATRAAGGITTGMPPAEEAIATAAATPGP